MSSLSEKAELIGIHVNAKSLMISVQSTHAHDQRRISSIVDNGTQFLHPASQIDKHIGHENLLHADLETSRSAR